MDPNQDVTKDNSNSFFSYPIRAYYDFEDGNDCRLISWNGSYYRLHPDDADNEVISNSWQCFSNLTEHLSKEEKKEICNSPAFRSRFKLTEKTGIFFNSTLEQEKTEGNLKKRIEVAGSFEHVIAVDINPVPKVEKKGIRAQSTEWLDIISDYLKNKPLPTKEKIDEKWNEFEAYFTVLEVNPESSEYPQYSEILKIIESPEDDRPLNPIESRIASEILERADKEIEKSFAFALQACICLPSHLRTTVWQLMRPHLKKEVKTTLESIIKDLLVEQDYKIDEILSIIQTLGIIALATPSVQGKYKFSLLGQTNDRLLQIIGPDLRLMFPFDLQSPALLVESTIEWRELMPVQFQLKNLFENFIPHTDSSATVCPQFKAICEMQCKNKNRNWTLTALSLMKSKNPFLTMLGYRLLFIDRALNLRPTMLDPWVYLNRLPTALAFIPLKQGEKKKEFYRQFSQCAGNLLTSQLLNLIDRVNWTRFSIGEMICAYIHLLAEDKSKEGFMRNAAWSLWFTTRTGRDVISPWTIILDVLLRNSDMGEKDKHHLSKICDTIKDRVQSKSLFPSEAHPLYNLLIPHAKNIDELQIRLAKDVYDLYLKAEPELLVAEKTIQLFVDVMTPLLSPQHLPLLNDMINLLLNSCGNVNSTALAKIIIKLCDLLKDSEPERAYEMWKRICNVCRKDPDPADIDFIISAARRMYRSLISNVVPQPDFPSLIQIIEKSKTTKISSTELRKFKLIISNKLTAEDLETAKEIIGESGDENHDFLFSLKCRVFKLRLEGIKEKEKLQDLLTEFKSLIESAKTPADYAKVEEIFHRYFQVACSKKLYNLIVVNRLIYTEQCSIHYGTTYYKLLNDLLSLLPRETKDEHHILEYLGRVISISVSSKCVSGIPDLAKTFVNLHKRKKQLDPRIQDLLKTAAQWLSKELEKQPSELQKNFLDVLIVRLPEELKNGLLPIWLKILRELLTKEYGQPLLKILEVFKNKKILASSYQPEQLILIYTLLNQWTAHQDVPCEVNSWIELFCALKPSTQFVNRHQEDIIKWIAALIEQGNLRAAIQLLKLIKPEAALPSWNRVLNACYEVQNYSLWVTTILENRKIFTHAAAITDFATRIVVAIETLTNLPKERNAALKNILQLIEHFPVSAQIWTTVLEQLQTFNNTELKKAVIRIITAPRFDHSIWSNDENYGLTCWTRVIVFMHETDCFERDWLVSMDFIEQPFVSCFLQDPAPFLIPLLSLHLRIPKQEPVEQRRIRLTEACKIQERIMKRRNQIPTKHRPQIVNLINQAAISGDIDLYLTVFRIAASIVKDKEAVGQAARAIEGLYAQAAQFRDLQQFSREIPGCLFDMTTGLMAEECMQVDFIQLSLSHSQCGFYSEALSCLIYALGNFTRMTRVNAEQQNAFLEPLLEMLVTNKKAFLSEEDVLEYSYDLISCLNHGLIASHVKRETLRKWREYIFNQLLAVLKPNAEKRTEEADRLLNNYAEFLKYTHPDDPIDHVLLKQMIDFIARNRTVEFCKKHLKSIDGPLVARLLNVKCRGYRESPEKHADQYFEFLHHVISTFGGEREFLDLIEDKNTRFYTCEMVARTVRTRMILCYAFGLIPKDPKFHEEHLAKTNAMVQYCLQNKLWDSPKTNPESCSVRLFLGIDENEICSNTKLDAGVIENILKFTINYCLNSRAPAGIQRGLTLLKDHLSLISPKIVCDVIFKDIVGIITKYNLNTTYCESHLILFSNCIEQLLNAKPINKLMHDIPQSGLVQEYTRTVLKVIKNSVISDQSHNDLLSRVIKEVIRLTKKIENDLDFTDVMSKILPQIVELKSHLQPETCRHLMHTFLDNLSVQRAFVDVKAVENLNLIAKAITAYIISDREFTFSSENNDLNILFERIRQQISHIPPSVGESIIRAAQRPATATQEPVIALETPVEDGDGGTTEEFSSSEDANDD